MVAASTRKTHSRLRAYSKATAASLAASTAACSAHAEVVYFPVNVDTSVDDSGVLFNNINVATQNVDIVAFTPGYFPTAGNYIAVGTAYGSLYAYGKWLNNPGVELLYTPLNAIKKFSYSTSINNTYTTWIDESWLSSSSWSGVGYVGFRVPASGSQYNYGWIEVNYNSPNLKVTGFAFETVPDLAIAAGVVPVPEPSTATAVGAGLFALAVGAHLRRRRAKQPAASNALLNLAAGARGVEQFRQDASPCVGE